MKRAPIHGLTVNQPWAFWIVRPDLQGPERGRAYGQGLLKGVVEAGPLPARQLVGHYLAIHAGISFEYVPARWLHERGIKVQHPPSDLVFNNVIIGVAYVTAFVTMSVPIPRGQRRWFTGSGLLLEHIVPIPPLAYTNVGGALWELPVHVLEQVRERFRWMAY